MIYNESKYNASWPTKRLEDLGTFSRGASKHRPRNDPALFEGGKYPLVQTGDVRKANLYIRTHEQCYNEFGLKQSKLWNAGTLCITIAANIANTAILSYPMCFPDSVVGFTAFPDECSEIFMHYVFAYIRQSIEKSASGSIQDNINIDYLSELELKIPEKPYQDKIVSILKPLDEKIDNNEKINEKILELVEGIFDRWFMQFEFPNKEGKPYKSSGGRLKHSPEMKMDVPFDWEIAKIRDVCDVVLGGTPSTEKSEYWENGNLPWLNSGEVAPIPVVVSELMITESGLTSSATTLMKKGTVVVSITGNIRCSFLGIDSCANQSVVGVLENDLLKREYLFEVMNKMVKKYTAISGGNCQKHINKTEVQETYLLVPDSVVLKEYYNITSKLFDEMVNNALENKRLTALRDEMLLMLMNGQIKAGE